MSEEKLAKDSAKSKPPAADSDSTEDAAAGGGEAATGLLSDLLSKFHLYTQRGGDPADEAAAPPRPEQLLDELSLEGVAKHIKSDKCENIIVMTGAGISTSAGIPDFRSPGTGLYDNLQKFNLPNPQAIFEIGFFKENPDPFFTLAKELYPGQFKPTPCHYFIKLLAQKGLLLRAYTQNIDTLERVAGVPGDLIMEAHGTFHKGHCIGECQKEYTQEWMRDEIFADRTPKCTDCKGLVKPDIVFFGEALPERFFPLVTEDFPECDLLIIMGTSLKVQPFASLVDRVRETTPRLLINMEKSGQGDPLMSLLGYGTGMDFDSDKKYRDVAQIGTCDEGCLKLAELLGWKRELQKMVKKEHAKMDAASAKGAAASSSSAAAAKASSNRPHAFKSAKSASKPVKPARNTSKLPSVSSISPKSPKVASKPAKSSSNASKPKSAKLTVKPTKKVSKPSKSVASKYVKPLTSTPKIASKPVKSVTSKSVKPITSSKGANSTSIASKPVKCASMSSKPVKCATVSLKPAKSANTDSSEHAKSENATSKRSKSANIASKPAKSASITSNPVLTGLEVLRLKGGSKSRNVATKPEKAINASKLVKSSNTALKPAIYFFGKNVL